MSGEEMDTQNDELQIDLQEVISLFEQLSLSTNEEKGICLEILENFITKSKEAVDKKNNLLFSSLFKSTFENEKFLNSRLFHAAVQEKKLNLVKYFINLGIFDINCVNDLDWTPLHLAAKNGDIKMIEFLLSKGANAYLYTRSPEKNIYHVAAISNQLHLLKYLKSTVGYNIFHTGDQNSEFNAFYHSIYEPKISPKIIKYLLDEGFDVDQVFWYGSTNALRIATQLDDFKLVKLLADLGADLYTRFTDKSTVLHYRRFFPGSNRYLIIKYLVLKSLEQMVDDNSQSNNNNNIIEENSIDNNVKKWKDNFIRYAITFQTPLMDMRDENGKLYNENASFATVFL